VLRRPGADDPALRCVYHGPAGCTIAPERRSTTCNDYVCEDALAEGPEVAAAARLAHERLTALHVRWDAELAPSGEAPWDDAFLDHLGNEHARLERRCATELGALTA
jgi:hypothetical protein